MQLTVNADSSRTPILANCRTEAMLTGWYSGCVPMGKASRGSKGGKGNDRKSLQSGVGTSYFVDECGFESRWQRKLLLLGQLAEQGARTEGSLCKNPVW